jgi:tetraacyldisaccharide 4'-kinase
MRDPSFWWRKAGPAARLLAPLAKVYGAVAAARLERPGQRVGRPVICIGNFTVGGAGKTPAALAVARMLMAQGGRPFFLSRGYGGKLACPLRVDPARHGADDVGDEPLLLARMAPTIVARDRVAGATAAIAAGAEVVVMDDGFQNASLAKDFSILIVDGRRGIGNGGIVPAGPLRAPLSAQLARTHALVVVGTGAGAADVGAPDVVGAARARNIPIFVAELAPDQNSIAALRRDRVLAFAGIGDPEKFFRTLTAAGIAVAARRSFPDHHRYTSAQAQTLRAEAEHGGLTLVTTEKDRARLVGDPALADLVAHTRVLPVALAFAEEDRFRSLLQQRIAARAASDP